MLALLLCILMVFSALTGVVCAADDEIAAADAVLSADDGMDEADAPVTLPDIEIVRYRKTKFVPFHTWLVFHTTADAPEGYQIVWSNGDIGSECIVENAEDAHYTIRADLVRISDGTVVRSTKEETVVVMRGPLARVCAKAVLWLYTTLLDDSFFAAILRFPLNKQSFFLCLDNRLYIDRMPAIFLMNNSISG